ncbi:aminotransferase class I/II-fold pyridoxal phosphate-dependent enzyme [bacterium]|nr:aminotransferase class I/II-fold pyridoxal phosphate-dependent enzyme [bacterium]
MLPDFRLEKFFTRWEFAARHHLTASDAESCRLGELLDDPQELMDLPLSYIPSEGGLELRQAIAATYDKIQVDQILTFCGAEEGLYCAMHCLLDRDCHAVVTYPNYQAMEELPIQLAGSVSGLALRPENDWEPDLDELRSLLRPNTRLVCVNFPNNPTGKVMTQRGWLELLNVLRERQIWLFSDEVYRGLERDPSHTLPQAADLYERALSLNVLSKAYGLPGLRLGWIACQDPQLMQRLLGFKLYLSICNSAPSEWLACRALTRGAQLLQRNRQLTRANLCLWDEFFAAREHLFEWKRPEGGCVAFPRYLGSEGVEAWCQAMLEQGGCLFLPASIYRSGLGQVPADRFRLGYGRKGLKEGLEALGRLV